MFSKITPEVALRLLKEVMGPPRREITGTEYNELYLVLAFLDPIEVTNNQRSITEVYHQAGKIYHVHYFTTADDPVIEEVLEDQ
jgi:hypothetical protein